MRFTDFFLFRKKRKNRELTEAELRLCDERERMWDRSPAPWILMLVLIWIVSAVLLVLSIRQLHGSDSLITGTPAANDFRSLSDFSIVDREETKRRKEEARRNAEVSFTLLAERTNEIERNLMDLFSCVETRCADLKQKRLYEVLKDSLPSSLAAGMSPALLAELDRVYRSSDGMEKFNRAWREMLQQGILPPELRGVYRMSQPARTIDKFKRITTGKQVGQFCDSEFAAGLLAKNIFPDERDSALYFEFRKILRTLLKSGNLALDKKRTAEILRKVETEQKDVVLKFSKGALLIKRGEIITSALRERAAASEEKVPEQQRPVMVVRVAVSLILLLLTIFYLRILQPENLYHNRMSSLCGAAVLLGLLVNYAAITFFQQNFASRIPPVLQNTVLYMFMPVALTSVVVTVSVGFRAAVCCGTFVSIITAMMLAPEMVWALILRYIVLSVAVAALVRRVTNYRSFFVRAFFAAAAIGLLCHADSLVDFLHQGAIPGSMLILSAGSAFASAVIALVTIFAFELIFNVSTDMSLMVLCDYNHPLLERLKREAPGTLFHCMTVSTLAEDAAKAIHANPLKAKAGALFHDIGKLTNAQFFSENNRSSGELHKELSPQKSADIIRDHVTEGLRLARQNHLCLLVREAIRTHHGDGIVYFFYAKAKEEAPKGTHIRVEDFSYTGVPPRSKELTIISLADVCEAASRSLNKPTPEQIRSLVNELFLRRWGDRQLRESELSLRELDLVRESFISTLNNIHHSRVAYTPEAIHEAAASQMEQSPSPRAAAR